MANFFQLDLLTIKGSLFSGKACFAVFPTTSGSLGVYAGHTPLLTKVSSGVLRVYTESLSDPADSSAVHPSESIVVSGGVLEILPTSVILLADMAIRTDEIDEESVLEAQLRAKETEFTSAAAGDERARMLQEIALVEAQIAALRQFRKLR
ncbi:MULTISPECIES: ATP synthase F1 subunit epsilon [Candidatus Ichthyocystis]|uniref:ATP synthase epsilon chain n=1 Tax=Candidatus Ichthyocystis hellenicum TaxID=1561003 RepID=A0A0S4LZX8_9BURK|nr:MULTISPECIES: ATP synthase F1 subunit epsilon [Ichthyocystis]CUT17125.1 ATP synthase subunit epsilon [Candidatus Ichthyocystis hellenicum]